MERNGILIKAKSCEYAQEYTLEVLIALHWNAVFSNIIARDKLRMHDDRITLITCAIFSTSETSAGPGCVAVDVRSSGSQSAIC